MRQPDFKGSGGSAWKVMKPADGRPDWAACIAQYLVNAPGAHPLWSWWMLAVIHLRDLPGVPPAHRKYPEAQYELMIITLNPEKPVPDPDHVKEGDIHFLSPPDVVEQFHHLNDEQSARLAEMCVRTIVAGAASPDSDYRSWWKAAVPKSIEHILTGGHPTVKA